MPRPKREREPIFRMFALNWDRGKIKRETGISERTFFTLQQEYEALSETDKRRIYVEATVEAKAKASFEDYEFVQKWIQRMQSEKVKSWKAMRNMGERVWLILSKKDPEKWTLDDIKLRVIPQLREIKGKGGGKIKSIFNYLVAIRRLRPDLQEGISTKREKAPINIEWRYAYKQIVQEHLTQAFFESARLPFKSIEDAEVRMKLEHESETIVRTHATVGCREGSRGEGGLLGLEWQRVDFVNKTIDVYEGKTGGGFHWLGCPLDLFGDKTFEMLKEWHRICGEPRQGKIFPNVKYYAKNQKHKRKVNEYVYDYQNKVAILDSIEPSTKLPYINLVALYDFIGKTLKLPIDIKPHFARKLHASLLKSSGVALELVAGESPHGIVGVGWEDLTTLKKFYVSFADEDIAKAKEKARQLAI